MDMLINLYVIPEPEALPDVRVERVLPPDTGKVLAWISEHFGEGWKNESSTALYAQPSSCYIAQKDGQCVGFACYDATARGYFGPIGIDESMRGSGIGKALLLTCLKGMREAGYGYAVVGWCNSAADFYKKSANAVPIPGSDAKDTVYGRLLAFSKKKEDDRA